MSEGTPKRPSFGSKMFGGAKNLTPTKVPSFTMQRKGSKAAEPTGVGGAVWVRDDEVCYRLATVTDVSGGEMKVRVNDTGATLSGKDFHPLDPQDEQEADLVQMVHVDTPNILNTLRKRHAGGCAYTNVGQKSIVISVNPYRWIDIYGTDVMREHYEAFGSRELSPHVFAIASDAYRALCVDGGSQAIITSGESGSGKTENTKQIFRFMAEIAGSRSEGAKDGGGVSLGMEGVLINSNPVLEAFGNAKTLRNNNSSRFGKLVTVHFDGWGKITGSHTKVCRLPAAIYPDAGPVSQAADL